jgi:hypothetical protein
VIKSSNGAGHIVGHRVQFQLRQSSIGGVSGCQGLALGGKGLVQRRPDLIEYAPQITAAPHLRAQLPDLFGQPIQPATAVDTAAHQISQGIAYRASREDVLANPINCLADIERRPQRIRATAPGSVAETVVGSVELIAFGVIVIAVVRTHDQACQAAP